MTQERGIMTADGSFDSVTKAQLVDVAGGFAPKSPGTFVGGTKTVADTGTPETLVASSTPCRAVWIGAPLTQSTGAATNTSFVMIGDATTQNIPLAPPNFEGYEIAIDDAVKIKIKVATNGDKVEFRIIADE